MPESCLVQIDLAHHLLELITTAIKHHADPNLQAAEPKKAPKSRKGRRAAVVEAEAADVHAEEIEIIADDEEEGADSAASQVSMYILGLPCHQLTTGCI